MATAPVAEAQDSDLRFSIEKTPDGYVRMDRRTGDMSVCADVAGQFTCRPANEERGRWQAELDRLSLRVSDLEMRLSAVETRPSDALPTEEQFEQGLTLMERFLRRFMGIAKDLENENARQPGPAQKT
jgi:hypothetical protein